MTFSSGEIPAKGQKNPFLDLKNEQKLLHFSMINERLKQDTRRGKRTFNQNFDSIIACLWKAHVMKSSIGKKCREITSLVEGLD